MLFGIIGAIAFYIALNIEEKKARERAIKEAKDEGYEVYFA